MQRRKGRDVAGSLELGNAIQFSTHVPVRKFTTLKLFKYLILIVLGILIHSMYKRIMQVHSNTPDTEGVDKRLKDIEEKLKPKYDEQVETREDTLKRHAESVFEEEKRKHEEREKMRELKEKVKEELRKEDEDEVAELTKNDELLKTINQKLKDKQHVLDDEIKEQAVEAKFDPVDEKEKTHLKEEMAIENDIAQILDSVNKAHKDDPNDSEENQAVNEQPVVNDGNQPFLKEPHVVDVKPKKVFVDKTAMLAQRFAPEKLPEGHHSHELPALVTATSQKTFVQVVQLIDSLQKFFPDKFIYVFDLDLHEPQRKKLSSACHVRLRAFWSNLFPSFVQNLTTYHWRPLVIQTAVAEFGDIIWINPTLRVTSSKLSQIVHDTEESGVMLIGQTVAHTTFAVTHPSMYKYIPTDKTQLYKSPHIEMNALVIHNTINIQENFMKILTACAIEENCLSPKGSKWDCDFDFSGKLYANCHRYDESAVNIILKNMFGFDDSQFATGNSFFQPYDHHIKSSMKICRHQR